jgi:hypothetical protein
MIAPFLVLLLPLAGADPGSAADRILLSDGDVILGQVLDNGPPNLLRLVVRRDWAREHLPDRLAYWEKLEATRARRARAERLGRLQAWRQERQAPADDPLAAWLAQQILTLEGAGPTEVNPLLVVEFARSQVRQVSRRPRQVAAHLRQAWRASLPDPESRPLADLLPALEGRGFAIAGNDPAPIDDLMPLQVESDPRWLLRRAATEVSREPALRYVRFGGLVLPQEEGGAAPAIDPQALLGPLLGELAGQPQADPLAAVQERLETQGRAGLLLTELQIDPDGRTIRAEASLHVRLRPGHWVRAIVRPIETRTDQLPPEAAAPLAGDPRIQGLFRAVEGLGLGDRLPDLRLAGGAALDAIGRARAALQHDLDALALPIP